MTKEDEHRDRIAAAFHSGLADNVGKLDLQGYPVDVVEIIRIVCDEWNLKPPRTKKSKAYWIQSARELVDACGEFGEELVREYRQWFRQYMKIHSGLAPFRVEGPGSLVKSVRALAGEKRDQPDDEEERRSYAFYEGKCVTCWEPEEDCTCYEEVTDE